MWNKCLAHRVHSSIGDHRRVDGWPIIQWWTGKASRGLTSANWTSAPQPTWRLLKRCGHVNFLSSPSVPVETDKFPIKVTPCHYRSSCLGMQHSASRYTVTESLTWKMSRHRKQQHNFPSPSPFLQYWNNINMFVCRLLFKIKFTAISKKIAAKRLLDIDNTHFAAVQYRSSVKVHLSPDCISQYLWLLLVQCSK